jgi:hypothetical protein
VRSLISALDELRAEDLRHRSDQELEDDYADLERAARTLQAEQARRLAEIQRRRTWQRDGYVSTVAWVGHRFRTSFGVAMRRVREASSLQEMPPTREALGEGKISPCAVRVLVGAREAHPEEFAAHERTLLDAAKALSARGLRRAVAYWRQALDGPKALESAEWRWAARSLYASPTLEGMVRVDGALDPETGQTLITALRAVVDSETGPIDEDPRTSAQRRADALGEICRQWLDRTPRPEVGGERPHIALTVGLDALKGRCAAPSEFDDVGPVHPEIVRRWACDASISRVIMRGRSEPLDIGRRTAVVPAALRRAVVLRDEHCRFPGCDRPHSWCDAHHIVHWADGGRTALSNLVLLCRRHHRMVHERFRLSMEAGRSVFRRPDGIPLEDRGPP